jgi:UDP-N-acetylglucosamine:LPS N-acetylglucosamine transferase
VPDSDLERAVDVVRALIADDAELAAMREAMLGAARPNAAEEIAEELVHLAAATRR